MAVRCAREGKKPLCAEGILRCPVCIFGRTYLHEAHSQHSHEGFFKNGHAHFALAVHAIHKSNRHFNCLETQSLGLVLHFDLKGIAHKADLAQVDRFEYFALVALEACRAIADAHPQDHVDVNGSKVAHQDTVPRPVLYLPPLDVARSNGKITTAVSACCPKANQVVRVVRKISIHLKEVVVLSLKTPAKTGNVCGTQALLPASLKKKKPVGMSFHHSLHNVGSAIRRTVVYHQNVKGVLKCQDHTNNAFDVFFLVVGWYDDEAVWQDGFRLAGGQI